MKLRLLFILTMSVIAVQALSGRQASSVLTLTVVDSLTNALLPSARIRDVRRSAQGLAVDGEWQPIQGAQTLIRIGPDVQWIVVTADGYIQRRLPSQHWLGRGHVSVTMRRAVSLSGRVLDSETMNSLVGARGHVMFGDGEQHVVAFQTDGEGKFLAEVAAGRVDVIVVAPGHSVAKRTVTAPVAAPLMIPLRRAASFSGLVLRPSGAPAPAGLIRLRPRRAEAFLLETRVLPDGKFYFRDVPADVNFEVIANSPDCRATKVGTVRFRPGEVVSDAQVSLQNCSSR